MEIKGTNLDGRDIANMNQYFYKGSFTYSERMRFQVRIEKEQMLPL